MKWAITISDNKCDIPNEQVVVNDMSNQPNSQFGQV